MQSSPAPNSSALTDLLNALRRRRTAIMWEEWLPVVTLDAEMPGTWLRAFRALSADEQCEVLDLLLRSDAGPLSGVLLIKLAANVEQIEDEQVRQTILHETSPAWDRAHDAIQHQRQSLKLRASNLSNRDAETLDLASSILQIESELAELKASEFEVNADFSRLHALESSYQYLERRKRILDFYDFDAAEKRVQTLQSELEEGEIKRAELQSAIQSLDQDLSQLRTDVQESTEQQTTIQPQIAELEAEQAKLQNAITEATTLIEQLRSSNAATRARRKELEAESQTLQTQADNIAVETSEWRSRCTRERERLEQLQRDADSAQRIDISDKISEVFQLLPADRADEGFHATAANRR